MKKVLFALMFAMSLFILTGCNEKEMLEEEAVGIVNQIIRENPGTIRGRCVKVELTTKLSEDKWEGFAIFDNGKKLPCYVTERFQYIEVELSPVDSNDEASVAETAVDVVNQIIRENSGQLKGHCKRVELTEKISDKKWKGVAHLDNGNSYNCKINCTDEGIEVEIEYVGWSW